MRDFVLTIIGVIGIFALAMSTKNVKENFIQNARTKVEKVVKNKHGEYALPTDQMPLINAPKAKINPSPKMTMENYKAGNGLGARDVTNLPYVTPTSHLNQNVNQPSPCLNLPSSIRYNPPSTSNMGITDNFQNKNIRENYTVNPNYSSSPLPKQEVNQNFNYPENDLLAAGEMKDPFDGKEVMIYDRPMTTTLKVGRFAGRGTRDLIRGDLPIAPSSHTGWFSTPADPSALTKGALQAMGGESESTKTMNSFMKIYGDVSNVGSGVNLNDPVDYQYTAYEMTNNRQGLNDNTINVLSF